MTLGLLLAAFLATGAASDLSSSGRGELVGETARWSVEPREGWTADQAWEASPGFQPAASANLRFGYSDRVYWVRWDWTRPAGDKRLLYLAQWPSQMDHVELFLRTDDGWAAPAYRLGDADPPDPRLTRHRLAAVPLPAGSGSMLVRLESTNSLLFEPRVFDADALVAADAANYAGLGLIFGFLLLMALSSGFLAVSLGDRLYLWYAGYLAALSVYLLVSTGALRGAVPSLGSLQNTLDVPSQALLVVASIAFAFRANRFGEWRPARGIAVLVGAGTLVGLAFQVTGDHRAALVAVHIASVAAGLGVEVGLVVQSLRGRRMSRFFLIGWSTLLMSSGMTVLGAVGAPGPWNDVVWNTGFMIVAFFVETTVFAVALADRVSQIQRQWNAFVQKSAHADRLAALGLAAARVGHEVNNPNHVIALNTAALETHLRRFEEAREDDQSARRWKAETATLVAGLRAASTQISQVVGNLRGGSQPPMQPRRLDLAALVRHTCRLYEVPWRDLGRVIVRTRLSSATIRGVEFRLQQLVVNLVTNALQALPGRDRAVTLTLLEAKDGFTLSVVDEGDGMSPEVMARLGEPFFTTKPEQGGTGLGWGLCQDIVREHGGHLVVESTPGLGTTVAVHLPSTQS